MHTTDPAHAIPTAAFGMVGELAFAYDLSSALSVTVAHDGIRILMPSAEATAQFADLLPDLRLVTIGGRGYTERRGQVTMANNGMGGGTLPVAVMGVNP